MPADALPSLFRWEPGMRLAGATVIGIDDRGLWVVPDGCFAASCLPPSGCRPDMSHAGTRGLVLEQVRAALGDPWVSTRWAWADTGCTSKHWLVCGEHGRVHGRGPTEGDAILEALDDAVHWAEALS